MQRIDQSKRYFTGIACARGHIAERFIRNNQCVECNKANRKAWALRYPGRASEWNKRNPEKMREIGRRCYANNSDKRKANVRRCVENNPAHYKRTRKEWKTEHADKVREAGRNRRARKVAAGGSHTAEDIADIYRLQSGRCAYCRTSLSSGYHVDHIQPLSAGGRNDRANIQLTCAHCNLSKNKKLPIEFARERGFLL